VRARTDAIDVHIADSLAGLEVEHLRAADRIADIGSGSGFPGLALAVALPAAIVDLVESVRRKVDVIVRLADAAALTNVAAICDRAEALAAGEGRARYGAVTARAVAALPVLVEYAAPLLREGGVFVAWKGRRRPQEEAAGRAAAGVVGLEPTDVLSVEPYPASRARRLYVYSKVRPTPDRFPRRPGMALKRPLRA
jgi:16S rRNA (guanine527-N7)-methyltransferase